MTTSARLSREVVDLLAELVQSDNETNGHPVLRPETQPRARDWLARILVLRPDLQAHLDHLRELFRTTLRVPASRWLERSKGQPARSAEPTAFRHADLLPEKTALKVADQGLGVLKDEAIASILLNPFALCDLADLINLRFPPCWYDLMGKVGRELMEARGLDESRLVGNKGISSKGPVSEANPGQEVVARSKAPSSLSSPQPLPDLVVHADWSSVPNKRWMARAVREGDSYRAMPPELVGPPATLLARLRANAGPSGRIFLGFDFPIGVPIAFARRAGIADFLALLPLLGQGPWGEFFDLAEHSDQINLRRPFYPLRPGGTSLQHLLDGLCLASRQDLLRACERRTATRRDACALFWTLGGNQVGRAAISGWRDVLAPALRDRTNPVAIWPFAGRLPDLFRTAGTVVAETYPTEFYNHLGVSFPPRRRNTQTGKQVQADRQANAGALLTWAAQLGVVLDPALRAAIQDGFGPSRDGEDPFDAVVGLFGMLNVVFGGRPSGEPDTAEVRTIEGWILGQAAGLLAPGPSAAI